MEEIKEFILIMLSEPPIKRLKIDNCLEIYVKALCIADIDRHIKIETGFNLEIQVALTLNEICEARMYKDSTNNAELVEQICHYMTGE